tara:strand:+ start:128 stop:493 length:366 start_codon:yes stop_codon:yes gene_type:complete
MANRHTKSPEEITPDIQKEIAARIATYARSHDENFSIDPFTIMAILNCIIAVVKLLYMCYSQESVFIGMKQGGVIQKFLLKREIRKQFSSKEDRKAVYEAIVDVSKSLSATELNDLLDSIK